MQVTPGLKSRKLGRRAQADDKQVEITSKRRMCTAFQTWRTCERPSCHRFHVCFGDASACFERYWSEYPKAFHAWIVAAGDARATGLTMRQAMRAANQQVRDGSACAELPWVRPYLKRFDRTVPTPTRRNARSSR
jgi:hypothetical protein